VLGPFLETTRVVPDVRIAQAAQQADRLLAERSGRATTIGDNVCGPLRKQPGGPPGDLGHRQIDRARDVKGRERFRGQYIQEDSASGPQDTDELFASDRHPIVPGD